MVKPTNAKVIISNDDVQTCISIKNLTLTFQLSLTANVMTEDVKDYLAKPIDLENLYQMLKQLKEAKNSE